MLKLKKNCYHLKIIRFPAVPEKSVSMSYILELYLHMSKICWSCVNGCLPLCWVTVGILICVWPPPLIAFNFQLAFIRNISTWLRLIWVCNAALQKKFCTKFHLILDRACCLVLLNIFYMYVYMYNPPLCTCVCTSYIAVLKKMLHPLLNAAQFSLKFLLLLHKEAE